jgi:hypothetical protein
MRIHRSVTSLSWIPSEAIEGLPKLPFAFGTFHYDTTPPAELGADIASSLEELRVADRFRFANHLAAWIDVDEHGTVLDAGYEGRGHLGATRVSLVGAAWMVAATSLPDRRVEPEIGDGWVRFTQTAGGRTGVPAPRTVRRPPFVQFRAPIAWSTLSLTIHADGRCEHSVAGASPFPRHWVYGDDGALALKTGITRFDDWWKHAFGKHTPWGDLDSPALVTEVETALERELSTVIMRGGEKPEMRRVKKGAALVSQGDAGDELFLLLDGVLAVEVDGTTLAEVGPGAVVGERAVIEQGQRTSTLRAITPCKVAAVRADQVDRDALVRLSAGHRRETTG